MVNFKILKFTTTWWDEEEKAAQEKKHTGSTTTGCKRKVSFCEGEDMEITHVTRNSVNDLPVMRATGKTSGFFLVVL